VRFLIILLMAVVPGLAQVCPNDATTLIGVMTDLGSLGDTAMQPPLILRAKWLAGTTLPVARTPHVVAHLSGRRVDPWLT
jgi:hypothetical protein